MFTILGFGVFILIVNVCYNIYYIVGIFRRNYQIPIQAEPYPGPVHARIGSKSPRKLPGLTKSLIWAYFRNRTIFQIVISGNWVSIFPKSIELPSL